ncbi:MAG: hypothetical protein GXX82_03075 [Syntrophorhabdus sp.]|nr:hypothetical protein [Syntrophorhabdus sp.]
MKKNPKITDIVSSLTYGDISRVQKLLDAGVDPNSAKDGRTLLYYAVCKYNFYGLDIPRLLLDRGANPNVPSRREKNKSRYRGSLPLSSACEHDDTEMVDLLLKYNADPNKLDGRKQDGETPFQTAVWMSNIKIVRALLDRGADVNIRNYGGYVPLHAACHGNKLDLVNLLLKHRAVPDIHADRNGNTPLHTSLWKSGEEIVSVLLQKGAEVNAQDKLGRTPLHIACQRKRVGIIRLLLKAGASTDIADFDGHTPLDAAIQIPDSDPEREKIMDLFREFAPELTFTAFCTIYLP